MRRYAKAILASLALLLLTLALGVGFAAATAPVVAIDAPSSVSYTSAHVSGTVDPEDQESSYYFQYSANPELEGWSYGAFQGPLAAGAGSTAVADDLTGLKPGTEYFVRLVGESQDGQSVSAEPNPSFTTDPVPVPVVSIEAPSSVTGSSAHLAGTIDPEAPAGNPAAFDVEWEFQCTPECPGLTGGTIPADSESHEVSAEASGLKAGVDYEVTLLVRNAGGEATAGPEAFRTLTLEPTVETQEATQVNGESAWLKGSVNPNGLPTRFYFEYGTSTAYGASVPTGEDASAGAGSDPVPVSEPLHDLAPNTTYHFRLVAVNELGTVAGEDLTFTTGSAGVVDSCPNAEVRAQQHAQYLPDCRAYELVSPARKGGNAVGGNFIFSSADINITADGESVSYSNVAPLPGSSSGSFSGFAATRGGSGWGNSSLLPKPGPNQIANGLPGLDAYLLGSTPDNRTSAYYDHTTEPYGSLWVIRADGTRIRVADATANPPNGYMGQLPGQPWFEGVSGDGRHVVFASTTSLLPDLPATGDEILYEWIDDGANEGAGTLRVVNRTNEPDLALIDVGAAGLGGSGIHDSFSGASPDSRHAISADGSRIYFQTRITPVHFLSKRSEGGGPIFLREDGSTTYEISAPTDGFTPANPPQSYQYLDASLDGRLAYFWANGDLTIDADPSGGIYCYDAQSRALTFLVAANPVGGLPPSGLTTPDGTSLYYQSADGIYLYRDGQATLVAPGLVAASAKFGEGNSPRIGLGSGPNVSANISPDGRILVFTAEVADARYEIFRYDADRDELEQLTHSTDQQGARFSTAGGLRVPISRIMSDDGRYVFFETYDELVPRDTNGTPDVYQWHDGEISLLSNGTFPFAEGSLFLGTDSLARNVFIATTDPLAPQDGDEIWDIYSVRAGGGFLKSTRADCVEDECQGPPNLQAGTEMVPSESSSSREGRGLTNLRLLRPHSPYVVRRSKVALRVWVSGSDQISAVLDYRTGGTLRPGGHSKRAVSGPGRATLRIPLTPKLVRHLEERRTIPVRLRVRCAGTDQEIRRSLTLVLPDHGGKSR